MLYYKLLQTIQPAYLKARGWNVTYTLVSNNINWHKHWLLISTTTLLLPRHGSEANSMLHEGWLQRTHIHALHERLFIHAVRVTTPMVCIFAHLQRPPITSFSDFLNCCKDCIFSVGIMKYSMLSKPPSVRVCCFLLPPLRSLLK